jgi:predicted TIM-barrel fold metal-dependent hydrolase
VRTDLGFKRIATEEAFATKDLIRAYRDLLARKGSDDIGFNSLMGYYLTNPSERTRAVSERLQDLGARRIDDMDATGIHMQILSITSPGVQIFDAPTGTALARAANDELAAAIAANPTRFAGLAAIAPQNPAAAAAELERGVRTLGLKGAIVNSHTQGEYLDDPKFCDIFAAAEALGVPVYIHPNTPPNDMIKPFMARGLDGAVFGFAVETGLHALRLVVSGVFDKFPKLNIVLGHLGESLLALPHRFHARRQRALGPVCEPAGAETKGQRLPEEQLLLHDERHGMDATDPLRAGRHGHGPAHVRDGLPVPIRAGGSERHGRAAHQLRGSQSVLSNERRARFQAIAGPGRGSRSRSYLLKLHQ